MTGVQTCSLPIYDAFVSLVKGMAIDDRMDFETARQIIDAHRQLMGEKEG